LLLIKLTVALKVSALLSCRGKISFHYESSSPCSRKYGIEYEVRSAWFQGGPVCQYCMPIIQGDIPQDVLKEAMRRGSKVVIPPQEREGSENAQTMQSTAESMASMTVNDPAPASSSITANMSNTAPVVTDKHTTAANDVLATIGPKQPNESKDLQNEEGNNSQSCRQQTR